MQKLTLEELTRLLESPTEAPSVTIYLPSHRTHSPPHMNEDQIRFKNLSKRALNLLEQHDKHNATFNKKIINQCNQLLRDRDFWEQMTESMVICARPGMFEFYHLPIDSDEYVAVDDHFHLTPLIGILHDMREFHVLSVRQHKPQLFRGDMYELHPAELTLPDSIEAALGIDELYQKSLQFSSTNSVNGVMYHGHGGGKDTGDVERLKFFRLIDGMVCYDVDTSLPLILAGTDSEVSEYRAISSHPNITTGYVEGSYDHDDTIKLHRKAAEIMSQEVIEQDHQMALDRFERLRGESPGRVAAYMEDLQDAAENGRVGTLLVGMSRKTRDTVRDNMQPVPKLVFPTEEDGRTLDQVVRQVFTKRGEIVNVSQDQMPEHKLALAINRY